MMGFPLCQKVRNMKIELFLVISLPFCGSLYANDFIIKTNDCRSLVSSMERGVKEIVVLNGDKPTFSCEIKDIYAICDIEFGPEAKPKDAVKYIITLDSSPHLYMKQENSAEVIAINTTENTASIVSRMFDPRYASTKLCTGEFQRLK